MSSRGSCFLCQEITERKCESCNAFGCSDGHLESHIFESQCLPYKVAHDSHHGRHFLATRDISEGETILFDPVSVVGPGNASSESLCLECFKVVEDPSICKCGFPFCSTCMNQVDGRHERECPQITRNAEDSQNNFNKLEYSSIFLLRFWMLRHHEPSKWERLKFLNAGETEDCVQSSIMAETLEVLRKTFGALDISSEEVKLMMGIKRTNASNLGSIGLQGVSALYPTYPLMNSYCYSNSRSVIDPKTFAMTVKANRKICMGEEISTRYVTLFEGQPRRRKLIWNGWKFICPCERCMDPTEFGTYFSALKCQACPGFILSTNHKDVLESPWCCDQCELVCENAEVERILEDLECIIKDYKDSVDPQLFIENHLQVKVPPSHFLIFQFKNSYFNGSVPNVNKRLFESLNNNQITELVKRMERQLSYGYEILDLIGILDPGHTGQKGSTLRSLATIKMQLAKLKFRMTKDQEEYNQYMGSALEMLKLISLCL